MHYLCRLQRLQIQIEDVRFLAIVIVGCRSCGFRLKRTELPRFNNRAFLQHPIWLAGWAGGQSNYFYFYALVIVSLFQALV